MDQAIADHIAFSNFPRGCSMDNKFFIILERIPLDRVKNKNALFLLCYHLANLILANHGKAFPPLCICYKCILPL
jgi:hypothetical protein